MLTNINVLEFLFSYNTLTRVNEQMKKESTTLILKSIIYLEKIRVIRVEIIRVNHF